MLPDPSDSDPAATWLAAAQAAAEAGDWPEAARLALAARPAWPTAAAPLAEIARWLRLAGRQAEAREALALAAGERPCLALAEEAAALDLPPPAAPAEAEPARLLLDIEDLLKYLADYGSISGIQRVQLGILAAVLEGRAGPLAAEARPVFATLSDGQLWAPLKEDLAAIIAHCATQRADAEAARRLVRQVRRRARLITPAPGSAFLILGAFWFYAGAARFLLGLRARGVRIGVLIYDLFPATNPEFATPDTVRYFNQGLNEGLLLWDFALAISRYSAEVFAATAARRGFPPLPAVPVPLAHRFDLAALPPSWVDDFPAALQDIRGRDFVLFVSTIEVRKNHLLLMRAWQRMIEEGEDPPILVFAGRRGWGVTDLLAQLDATRCLDGRIVIAEGLSDLELAALYRHCLFTVMPSLAEGWGLAVGESLAFGKPCIASRSSALPEVGGDLIAYADPGSVPEWVERLRAWIHDRAALQAAAERIRREFRPRSWSEVTADLLREAMRLAALGPRPDGLAAEPFLLPLEEWVPLGRSFAAESGPEAAARGIAQGISLAEGWYPVETSCTWMRGSEARIRLRSSAPPGSLLRLELDLGTPPWPNVPNSVTVTIPGGRPARASLQPATRWRLAVAGPVAADGLIEITLRLERPGIAYPADPRQLALALFAIRAERLERLPEPEPSPATAAHPAGPAEPPRKEEVEAAPKSSAPPAQLLALPRPGLRAAVAAHWARLHAPLRSLRLRGDLALARGRPGRAAEFYARYLRRRPEDAAVLTRRAWALTLAGDHAEAARAFRAAMARGVAAAELAALAATRAALPGGRAVLLDLSALLLPQPWSISWAARRWRRGLAQALLARPEVRPVVLPPGAGQALLLPAALAQAAIAHPEPAPLLAEEGPFAGLAPAEPRPGERVLLLDPSAGAAGWRRAREAGAEVVLLLSEAAALTAPAEVAPTLAEAVARLLFGPQPPCDGLALPVPLPDLPARLAAAGRPLLGLLPLPLCLEPELPGGHRPDLPEEGYVLASRATPALTVAWSLLAGEGPALPPLFVLEGEGPMARPLPLAEGTQLAPLLARCRGVVLASPAEAWPALLLAATAAERPCLAPPLPGLELPAPLRFDPLDLRASAAALRALITDGRARAALVAAQRDALAVRAGSRDWAELAELCTTAPLTPPPLPPPPPPPLDRALPWPHAWARHAVGAAV
ncbi:MAG: glycosyltransferase [Rhodovarius sp.]|nr:glycosyltransferase [Rhodovarius sp.]